MVRNIEFHQEITSATKGTCKKSLITNRQSDLFSHWINQFGIIRNNDCKSFIFIYSVIR